MSNTYTQAYAHFIFSTKGRKPLLQKEWRHELFAFMAEVVTARKQKSIAVNGVEDHVHLLVGFKPDIALSSLIRDVKRNSSVFLKEKNFVNAEFAWQAGYGMFTHSHSNLDSVFHYIQNQENHHRIKTFEQEYIAFLEKYAVNYNPKYLFG